MTLLTNNAQPPVAGLLAPHLQGFNVSAEIIDTVEGSLSCLRAALSEDSSQQYQQFKEDISQMHRAVVLCLTNVVAALLDDADRMEHTVQISNGLFESLHEFSMMDTSGALHCEESYPTVGRLLGSLLFSLGSAAHHFAELDIVEECRQQQRLTEQNSTSTTTPYELCACALERAGISLARLWARTVRETSSGNKGQLGIPEIFVNHASLVADVVASMQEASLHLVTWSSGLYLWKY